MMEEYEYMIHRYMNKQERDSNQDTLDKLIEELPYITNPAMMEDCKDAVYRDMNEKTETNQETLYKVIEELPDITSPDIMDSCINEELENSKNNSMNKKKTFIDD